MMGTTKPNVTHDASGASTAASRNIGKCSSIIPVVTLVTLLTFAGVPSGLAQASSGHLYGKVKATNADVIQVLVEGKIYAIPSNLDIRDEEGGIRRLNQVYRGVGVVLHLKEGRIVGLTLLAD